MIMACAQYSLQLHIHINTISNYILYVNVVLFKQTREKRCNAMLSFHHTESLAQHQAMFLAGWVFTFDTYPLEAPGLGVRGGERPPTSGSRTGAAAKEREAGGTPHTAGLRNSVYSTSLEMQPVLLRRLPK